MTEQYLIFGLVGLVLFVLLGSVFVVATMIKRADKRESELNAKIDSKEARIEQDNRQQLTATKENELISQGYNGAKAAKDTMEVMFSKYEDMVRHVLQGEKGRASELYAFMETQNQRLERVANKAIDASKEFNEIRKLSEHKANNQSTKNAELISKIESMTAKMCGMQEGTMAALLLEKTRLEERLVQRVPTHQNCVVLKMKDDFGQEHTTDLVSAGDGLKKSGNVIKPSTIKTKKQSAENNGCENNVEAWELNAVMYTSIQVPAGFALVVDSGEFGRDNSSPCRLKLQTPKGDKIISDYVQTEFYAFDGPIRIEACDYDHTVTMMVDAKNESFVIKQAKLNYHFEIGPDALLGQPV